jgi:hypothetical protein
LSTVILCVNLVSYVLHPGYTHGNGGSSIWLEIGYNPQISIKAQE